jgi:hypothetical protein
MRPTRPGRPRPLTALLAILALVASAMAIGAPSASALPVENPGPFIMDLEGGLIQIKDLAFDLTPSEFPECSDGVDNDEDGNIDFPADLQCTSAEDDSELAPGFQLKEAIVVAGDIAANGTVTVPSTVRTSEVEARALGGVYFPPSYANFSGIVTTIRILPLGPGNFTGVLDPDTGDFNFTMTVTIKLEASLFGSNCFIAPSGITFPLTTGTTNPPAPNTPISGSGYNRSTGQVTVVNNDYAVPATSCGTWGPIIDSNLGLPSDAGNNTVIFDLVSDPIFNEEEGEPTNTPPVANAGPNQVVSGGSFVQLDGTGSSDADDDELEYSWEQISGTPTVVLSGANTATPSFTAPAGPATLVFELTVDDGTDTDTDQVTIDVVPEGIEHDLSVIPFLKYEVNAHKDLTKFQVWVTNEIGPKTPVDIADVSVSATVNGDPVDPGEFAIIKPVIRNISETKTGKFGFVWNHGKHNLRGGDLIEITACVAGLNDDNPANDCGTISRPAGTIDLAANADKAKDVRVKNLLTKFKVSLYNVGEVRVPLDYHDVDVSITVNGEPVAPPTKISPIDKETLLPKVKMVKEPVFKLDEWRYKALHVGLQWDHGQLQLGDEIKITVCSLVPGDVDSAVPSPPLFEPTTNNNCTTATRFVVP